MAPRAVFRNLKSLRTWTKNRSSKVDMMVAGNGNAGSRATPTQTKASDELMGLRVHFGEEIMIGGKQHKRLHLKICKGASDPTLKDLANKDPNKEWSHADVPMNTPAADKETVFDQIWVDFETNMKD